ncbi:alpha-tocopherol transfer protein-like [Anopheles maculipalpis]|uniref:alpha-tocopherol transfer protein-like n=1 Tax=Anopheles maculipalpis TaxID=1496333 RepID=UPI002158F0DD|nr:alpha-tocopherol transfer protein-like [Anopheles maculipalpis]
MDSGGNNELARWPSVDRESIEKIKQWLSTQEHLPQLQDHEIALFLHANYGNEEATQRTIENYYTLRTSHRECFTDRDVFNDALQTALRIMMFTTLPGETKEGYKMVYTRLLITDASEFNHPQILKLMTMCLDLWVKLEGNANGHIMLTDMQGMHLGHMTKLNMGASKKHMFYVQEALPIRLKQIHFVNVVPFMNRIMFLMRPFLRKDVQEMINMHVDIDTLRKVVPVESLPNEYGGTAGTFQELHESFKDKLYANSNWFRSMESRYLVDEEKRIPKPRRYMFGLFG